MLYMSLLQDNITLPEHHQEFVTKGLRTRLTIYFVLSLILVGIATYHVVVDKVGFIYPIVTFIIGNIAGFLFARILKIRWDNTEKKVTFSFDVLSILLLLMYVLIEIFRTRIVGYFITGPWIIALSFALFAGIMHGRVLGTRRKVRELLEDHATQ
jgi:uncharacterized membrane protein YraQ (UPF0718 family)